MFHLLDDHSRKALAAHACFGETGQGAWACFTTAVEQHGLPAMILTDNGSAFSGKCRGWQAPFETNLAALGVHAVTSSPYHPQTCGKSERSHRTARQWLKRQPAARNLTELQHQMNTFNELYNTRPHQGIAGQTPTERWDTADIEPPPTPANTHAAPMHITTGTVDPRGAIAADGCTVQVGREWEHTTLTICRQADHVVIFHNNTIVRELTLDRTRRYQPSKRPRGGRRHRRRHTNN